jgi:hypothetical protein
MNTWLIWQPTPVAPWATLAILIAAGVALHQYLRVRVAGPFVMRGIALLLLLFWTWQPSLRFIEAATSAGPLRIVVDDSLSMNVIDASRTAGDWLRVATALGQFAGDHRHTPQQDLEQLRAALRELSRADQAFKAARQADPIAAQERAAMTNARETASRAAQALRASAEAAGCGEAVIQALDRMIESLGDLSDVTAVIATLDEVAADIRERSRDLDDGTAGSDTAAIRAVERMRTQTRFELAMAAAGRIRAAHPGQSTLAGLDGTIGHEPAAVTTKLTESLRDACLRAVAEKAEAVVLLSDGRSTESRSILASVASTGQPVFTVAVAPEDRTPDVSVSRMEARPLVLAGQPVNVRIRLAQRNASGQTVQVVVTDGTQSVVLSVQVGGDNTLEMLWPEVKPPGVKLTAKVEGLIGESQKLNNTQATYVAAVDRRQQVLLLAGPSGRDTGEFADAVSASPWMELHRPRINSITPQFANIQAELQAADLIVLADVPANSMDDAGWAALLRVVRQGKSLLVLAGNGEWLAEPEVARRLGPLLPVTPGPKPAWVDQPVWTVPTRSGAESPFLRLDESAEASYRAWLGRPRLARVLGVGPVAAGARPLLLDRTTQAPVLIDGMAGTGRTMLLLTDAIWQWTVEGDEGARRFWIGLADSLYDFPYAEQSTPLWLAVDRVDLTAGRTFYARVRATNPAAGSPTVSVTANGTAYGPPPVREYLPGSGRYIVPLNLPAGTFELTVRQGATALRTTLKVSDDVQQELTDTTPDNGLLRRIADATGGSALTLDQIGQLPDLLLRRREREERVETYALWSSAYGFVAVVACLGLEWAWRPRARLA